MDSDAWDLRYAASEQVWSIEPNRWVSQTLADHPVGTALDLASGEGRNALWLAEQGWQVTAVDFSGVALERTRARARQQLGTDASRVKTAQADVLEYRPGARAYDLVLVSYLHLPQPQRRTVMRTAASAVAPGGILLVVAHDLSNLTEGVGGPPDPAVLHTPEDIVADLEGTGLAVQRAELVYRDVETEQGQGDEAQRQAIDNLVLAKRPV